MQSKYDGNKWWKRRVIFFCCAKPDLMYLLLGRKKTAARWPVLLNPTFAFRVQIPSSVNEYISHPYYVYVYIIQLYEWSRRRFCI